MRSGWLLGLFLAAAGCAGSSAPNASAEPADGDPRPPGPVMIAVPPITIPTAPDAIASGKELYTKKGCPACHKIGDGKLVGPDLRGVTARRNPRWIARIILHPEVMLMIDPTAKELLRDHVAPMANQHINPTSELPLLLAYLKANER